MRKTTHKENNFGVVHPADNGYWVIRRYTAGVVGEKTKYFIPGERSRRSRQLERQEIRKQDKNEHSAVKAAARVINANFGKGDLLLGLDYSDDWLKKIIESVPGFTKLPEPEQKEQLFELASKQLVLVIRRVNRELAKHGQSLKYFAVTSDMDGETGEAVRVHHHLIISAAAKEIFIKKWKKQGNVNWREMSGQGDYTPIAAYLLKQVRKNKNENKYTTSRNLIRVRPRDRIAISDSELRVPTGGLLLYRSSFIPGKPQYIRFFIPPSERKDLKKHE